MQEASWADFFNGHAPVYDENCFAKNTLAEIDFLERELQLRPEMTLLDVGCGTGRHSIELARRGYRMTGIDISAGMLAEARRKAAAAGITVSWIEGDAKDFSFPEPFDAAICLCEGSFGLLGTVDDPIGQPWAILRNISESLKIGAPSLFTVLNAHALSRRYSAAEIAAGKFDPVALTERSDFGTPAEEEGTFLRERAFVPTELVLLFGLVGLEVLNIWGGTAGNWGKRTIDLDEIEIMLVARKAAEPVQPPFAIYGDARMGRRFGRQRGS